MFYLRQSFWRIAAPISKLWTPVGFVVLQWCLVYEDEFLEFLGLEDARVTPLFWFTWSVRTSPMVQTMHMRRHVA
jgi:hypothetical protein